MPFSKEMYLSRTSAPTHFRMKGISHQFSIPCDSGSKRNVFEVVLRQEVINMAPSTCMLSCSFNTSYNHDTSTTLLHVPTASTHHFRHYPNIIKQPASHNHTQSHTSIITGDANCENHHYSIRSTHRLPLQQNEFKDRQVLQSPPLPKGCSKS